MRILVHLMRIFPIRVKIGGVERGKIRFVVEVGEWKGEKRKVLRSSYSVIVLSWGSGGGEFRSERCEALKGPKTDSTVSLLQLTRDYSKQPRMHDRRNH